MKRRPPPSWPLFLLAMPAFVAVWSGWVGLGQLTGFGVIHPFPGTPLRGLTLDTAITLPIGVETYGAYALLVWLSGSCSETATKFARASSIGSLILGAAGQVAYHLMVAAGITKAPWWITTVVSTLPVAVFGMGAALAHLVQTTTNHTETDPTALAAGAEPDTSLEPKSDVDADLVSVPTPVTPAGEDTEAGTPSETQTTPAEPEASAAPAPAHGTSRTGGPRTPAKATDADLLSRIDDLVADGGLEPGQVTGNRMRGELGVGADRAARLAEAWQETHRRATIHALPAAGTGRK